jgi:hypothetical protein
MKVAGCGLRFWLQTADARGGGERGLIGETAKIPPQKRVVESFGIFFCRFLSALAFLSEQEDESPKA